MPRKKRSKRSSDQDRVQTARYETPRKIYKRRKTLKLKQKQEEGAQRAHEKGMPLRKIASNNTALQQTLINRRKKRAQHTDIHGTVPVYSRPIRGTSSACSRRAERRAVLLAKGKVNRPGGAPGPYKARNNVKCR